MISYQSISDEFDKLIEGIEDPKDTIKMGVSFRTQNNVISGEKLRKVQKDTLTDLKNFLSMTFGPMGSNTKIITGNDKSTISSSYSKDGLKVLKNIAESGPVEMSIIEEIIDITRHVEHEVGDGTTSTVILSSLIFDRLIKIQKKFNIPPYQLIRRFGDVVDRIKNIILSEVKNCTLDDIYDISMISTNGNVEVSNNIRKIYEEYGMNVDLSVGISNDSNSKIKAYDGLTISEGMSDPVFINRKAEGTCEIRNAKVYHFTDPIDTMELIQYFEKILEVNIYDKYSNDEAPIPTVITCPRISRDMSNTLKQLSNQLYQFNNNETAKPPILIITNVVASDEIIMDDIANLCGCKSIHKYIDPNVLKKDQEAGVAPTLENVHEFGGECELVIADSKKTKFINPKHMKIYNEDGTVEDDPIYTAMVNFLETEIENTKSDSDTNELGLLKKRLSALKANMVEYLVGGITIADRDAVKDLVEDAIKNTKSATLYGVGRAANYEGLEAAYFLLQKYEYEVENEIETAIAECIFLSYCDIAKVLYGTVSNDEDEITEALVKSLDLHNPFDISSGSIPVEPSDKVKCSIMLDVNILDTISKIITMMVTCNQCLLQAPQLNTY